MQKTTTQQQHQTRDYYFLLVKSQHTRTVQHRGDCEVPAQETKTSKATLFINLNFTKYENEIGISRGYSHLLLLGIKMVRVDILLNLGIVKSGFDVSKIFQIRRK